MTIDIPLLEVRDVSFTHLGQQEPTLNQVQLKLHPGELVLLAGATGSGKSTLLNCITGISPEHVGGKLGGQVLYQGNEITHRSIRARSQFMGIMLQNVETQLFTDQVWDELVFGLENWNLLPGDIQAIAQAALVEFGLVHQQDWMIRQLSAGQKQRLLLACLLARQQDILLLDEPFAFLDMAGVNLLLQLLQSKVQQGQTVLLIEHRIELLDNIPHRAYKIDRGQVSEWKSVPHLTQSSKVLTSQAEHQFLDVNTSKPEISQSIITTQNLSFDGYPAFPDLQVQAGEVVLLKGSNGCGKTTLLRLLSGLIQPSTGSITIQGQNATRWNALKASKWVGFVLQNPNHQLFGDSVLAEVEQVGVSEEKALQILKQINLQDHVEKHPHALSQGQKRRLALGAVLARETPICLLDEITVGQDPLSLELMIHALQIYIQGGGTLIFTSHDPGVEKMLNARCIQIA